MPEMPDIELYLHALRPRLLGRTVLDVRLASPFVVRSTTLPIETLRGRIVVALARLGKRLVLDLGDLFLVIHLMVAGRLRWTAPGAAIPKRLGLLALDFEAGSVQLTEAGSKRRASVHVVEGQAALAALDPGGLEVLDVTFAQFRARLATERHTLKRSLTDPRMFSGIGNAYSDEILHHARLSPLTLSDALSESDLERLFDAIKTVLPEWRSKLIAAVGDRFPTSVTAFRDGMAVHGRYGKPCPRCATPVQRLRYASNEANYCPSCQTGGRLLADRGLSRLLREDWPRTLDELERLKASRRLT